jgi:hypothetical protein
VGIIIEGDKSLSYQEVKKRLAAKKWDIVFARSPMIARFSQKQSYSYLAGMFPGSATYKSGIFVKVNSPIRSIELSVYYSQVSFSIEITDDCKRSNSQRCAYHCQSSCKYLMSIW